MSADYVSECPNCVRENKKKLDSLNELKREQYGKLSTEEYDRLNAEIARLGKGPGETFPQYYEVYLKDGQLNFEFGARCSVCDYEFNKNVSWPLFGEHDV